MVIFNEGLAVRKKGIGVIENIIIARTLMYSSVYFHKTVRIAEMMLSKAIEMLTNIEPFELFKMTDDELLNMLYREGKYQHEIATRIKFRNLFKQAYTSTKAELNQEDIEKIRYLENRDKRRKKEKEIEETLNIPSGHIIIDIPYQELFQAEPRIHKTDIDILDGENVKTLDDFTPMANAIKTRAIPDWMVMIITDEKYREIVSEKAEKILFS